MRVALRHSCCFVPQQTLHLVQIDTSLCEPSGKGVSQIVKAEIAQRCLRCPESECSREVTRNTVSANVRVGFVDT